MYYCVGICVYIFDFVLFFGFLLEMFYFVVVSGFGLLGFIIGLFIGY